jgi:hypothetical protein
MAKFGSFDPAVSDSPREVVEADFMSHEHEFVKLMKKGNESEPSQIVAVFRLKEGSNVRKIE